jgi:hypothetical protein
MADDATLRTRIIARTRPRTTGRGKVHKSLGWERVRVSGQEYAEPVDWVPANYSGGASEKEITGYEFIDGGTPWTSGLDGVNGNVTGPENQG